MIEKTTISAPCNIYILTDALGLTMWIFLPFLQILAIDAKCFVLYVFTQLKCESLSAKPAKHTG